MKVLEIIGAKRGGNTDKLADQFAKGALAAGNEVEKAYLFDKDMHGCIDCQTCMGNGGTCIWKDDVPAIIEAMLSADVLVFASPVYFFSISSQLKMLLDRTYVALSKMKDKRCYFIATAEGPSDVYEAGFAKVAAPIEGYLQCFESMTLEGTVAFFDMGLVADVAETSAFKAAELVGSSL